MTVEQVKQKLHTSKAKQGVHSWLPMGKQVFSHSQEIRAPSHTVVTWEKKHQHSECPPSPFSFPSFICHMVWNIALWSAVLGVSPHKFLCTLSLLTGGCANTA